MRSTLFLSNKAAYDMLFIIFSLKCDWSYLGLVHFIWRVTMIVPLWRFKKKKLCMNHDFMVGRGCVIWLFYDICLYRVVYLRSNALEKSYRVNMHIEHLVVKWTFRKARIRALHPFHDDWNRLIRITKLGHLKQNARFGNLVLPVNTPDDINLSLLSYKLVILFIIYQRSIISPLPIELFKHSYLACF